MGQFGYVQEKEHRLLHKRRHPGLLALRRDNGRLQPAQRSVQHTLQLHPLACNHTVDTVTGKGSSGYPEVCLSHHLLYALCSALYNLRAPTQVTSPYA